MGMHACVQLGMVLHWVRLRTPAPFPCAGGAPWRAADMHARALACELVPVMLWRHAPKRGSEPGSESPSFMDVSVAVVVGNGLCVGTQGDVRHRHPSLRGVCSACTAAHAHRTRPLPSCSP